MIGGLGGGGIVAVAGIFILYAVMLRVPGC
jgi:hypothetical protein